MSAQIQLDKFLNPKDHCLIVPISEFELFTKSSKNHISQFVKNRINYLKYAEYCVKSLSTVDPRFKELSPVFLKEILYPALGAEMASVNKENKSKEVANFPNYSQMLKGVNFFYKACNIKIRLNQSEYSLVSEVEFLKSNLSRSVG